MKYIYTLLLALLFGATQAQIVINEVDADQNGTDASEFVELYGTPGASLNGYVLVFFNGANNQSYLTVDLSGNSIPASGYYVVGNAAVANLNQTINGNAIQNGADGIGLYQASAASWPNASVASTTGLIDAIVYGTGDAPAATLIATLTPGQTQVDETAATPASNLSSSRIPDGGSPFILSTYVAQNPTPGASNSGTISGCTDNAACNYNALATVDNGTCAFPGDACNDNNANTTNDTYDGTCACVGVIAGCMDNTACNYNASAVIDNGTCAFPGDACNDNNANTTGDIYDGSCNCAGTPSGSSSILAARGTAVGASVTVTGTVTNGAEMGSSVRYIQDSQAGIAIYPGLDWTAWGVTPLRGDIITVTGVLTQYNGLLEVGSTLTAVTINSSNNTLPTLQLVTPNVVAESYEGELVTVDNVVFDLAGSVISGNSTYTYTANGQSGVIYIRAGSVLVGTNLPASAITLVGIVSQFDATAPFDGGYQILPRDENDFILPPGVAIIGTVTQTNITTSSFDLNWVTNNGGDSQVNYGPTPSLGQTVSINESVTNHVVNIPGLQPGTIYYASVTSSNVDGSSTSSVRPYATKSLSSGEIRTYFTRQVDNSYATIENAISLGTLTNDTIAAYISRAQQAVDIAIYNFTDDAVIANAINGRYNAGVQVRIVADGSTAQLGLSLLNPNIPVVERVNTSGTGIMHNKFIVVDPDSAANSWVFTGSTNWTDNNMSNDFNNIIIFQDQSIARGYRLEFEEMWGGNGPLPGNPNGVFGASKTNNTPLQYVMGPDDIKVESYFSPTDNANGAIIKTMQTTDVNLDYAILAFTRADIADAIIAEDDLFLVLVRGMMEQTSDPASEFAYLEAAGQDIRSHENIQYDLHHKYCIVDHSTLDSDPTVLTGSHNWSSAAQTTNDENTVVVHDARVANLYLQEFMATWSLVGVEDEANNDMSVYPNPASYNLWVGVPVQSGKAILNIFNAQGQLVHTENLNAGMNSVSLPSLAVGTYVCKVSNDTNLWTKTIIIK
jgi:phosphatidylserine/phosphatidylglycerophosphate/cardiolipin synthase-like enzyme